MSVGEMSVGEMSLIPGGGAEGVGRLMYRLAAIFYLFQFYILAITDVQEVLMTR